MTDLRLGNRILREAAGSNLIKSPERLQAFNRKMPLGAAWLSYRVLVSEEASLSDRIVKIDYLYPPDADKMLAVRFIEYVWCFNFNLS